MDPSTKTLRERLPSALLEKLDAFRRDVRRIKLQESLLTGVSIILGAFLVAFALDRIFDVTIPGRIVWVVLIVATLAAIISKYLSGTHFSTSEWTGLARLLEKKYPGPGDRLLGILEIGSDDDEWGRSRTLSQAAISKVSAELRVTDFDQALPMPGFLLLGSTVFGTAFVILVMAFVIPEPVANTALRWGAPWLQTERYTFAQPEAMESVVYVAKGEDYEVPVRLKKNSPWKPDKAVVTLTGREPVPFQLVKKEGSDFYQVAIPAHSDSRNMDIRIGDHKLKLMIEPKDRSSVESAQANIQLPDYLMRSSQLTRDIRAGLLSMVQGSSAEVHVSIDREIASVSVDPGEFATQGNSIRFQIDPLESLDGISKKISWTDIYNLEGNSDYKLNVRVLEDESPGIVIEGLSRTRVILETDTLDFSAQVNDDFGIREVGMVWTGDGDPEQGSKPSSGEKLFASNEPENQDLRLIGTFSAQDLKIAPQPLRVKFFVNDYFPERERVFTEEYLFYVLNEDQHLQWITRQLTRWQQDALLVKSKEEQLHRTNKELRNLSGSELESEETKRRIKAQASAEKANGRRLSGLSKSGEGLLQEAARNSQFGPGTLENWAEILNILKDISGSRMPSVENLLNDAANQPAMASSSGNPSSGSPSEGGQSDNKVANEDQNQKVSDSKGSNEKSQSGPMVGQNRGGSSSKGESAGKDDEEKKDEEESSSVPSIVDRESSLQPDDPDAKEEEQPQTAQGPSPKPSLGLPGTTLKDISKGSPQQPQPTPPQEKLEEAVIEQENLLAEFEKVSEELNQILAGLEGSTFVKRLKAASRAQTELAKSLGEQVVGSFGLSSIRQNDSAKSAFTELKGQDRSNLTKLDEIHKDMEAYYQRKQFTKFRNVLDEMEKLDPFTGLDTKSEVMDEEVGWSFSMTEFWADTFDRWAEDLVDPASGGT